MHAPQPLLAPGGRSASLQTLARAVAALTGRLLAVDGQELRFDGSVTAKIDAADAFATQIQALLDDAARRAVRPWLSNPTPPTSRSRSIRPPLSTPVTSASNCQYLWMKIF